MHLAVDRVTTMRETDESRADLQAVKNDMLMSAEILAKVMDGAERGEMKPDPAGVRKLTDSLRGVIDDVEAQLLARIPSVRP
jgi:hypothetical protein